MQMSFTRGIAAGLVWATTETSLPYHALKFRTIPSAACDRCSQEVLGAAKEFKKGSEYTSAMQGLRTFYR